MSKSKPFSEIDTLAINTIRTLSIDAIQKSDSGHPGLPMGCAPMATVLWSRHLKHTPGATQWPDRDRFVLSAGHGSMLLYSLLHVNGYDVSLDEIKNFRQWKSKTPGHPEAFYTSGVEATTGPLGQGASNAVGMAVAERLLANHFNRDGFEIFNHFTYALVSDGDLMEGVSCEAASFAGHVGLGKLIYLYDSNDITLDGPASLAFSKEDVAKRFESYGWQVITVKNGDTDLTAIDEALTAAKADLARPSLILIKTTIGYGSPNKAGKSSCHGSPLGNDEIALTKKQLGWKHTESFYVPDEVKGFFREGHANAEEKKWRETLAKYQEAHSALAEELSAAVSNKLPKDWEKSLPTFAQGTNEATRVSSGKVINAIAKSLPLLIGGDADLSCSTNTFIKDGGSFEAASGKGRNIHYGVREHAMGAIQNGILYHGGLRAFTATFFCFSDYMRPAVRLAAMNHLPAIYVWTHDSIGLGEDGPTHQPVEHLMSLRAMPGLCVLRPCDADEVKWAWKVAIERKNGPTALVLSRQKVIHVDRTKPGFKDAAFTEKGAYILREASGAKPKAILIATGAEVSLALASAEQLEKEGVATRVVSMPSFELFQAQSESYREDVLPKSVSARVSIEAGVSFGWERWVGDRGLSIAIDHFGASAPAEILFKEFGFTVGNVIKSVKKSLVS